MTNQDIIQGLINRDERITQEFFFRKCQPIIFSIVSRYYPSGADYDELTNDLYLHLMENDAHCLRMYEGRSSIYQWVKIVAKNFFLDKFYRDNVVEYESDSRLLDKAKELLTDNSVLEAAMDVATENSWLSDKGALIESLGNTSLLYGLNVEKMYNASLQEIVSALNEGKKVMAAVDGGELIGNPVEECIEDVLAGGIVDHCVIVLSVSLNDDEVSLYDPAFGPIPLSVSIAHFMDAWEDSNYYCILIGENGKAE